MNGKGASGFEMSGKSIHPVGLVNSNLITVSIKMIIFAYLLGTKNQASCLIEPRSPWEHNFHPVNGQYTIESKRQQCVYEMYM